MKDSITSQKPAASAFGGRVEIIGPGAETVARKLEERAAGEAAHTPTYHIATDGVTLLYGDRNDPEIVGRLESRDIMAVENPAMHRAFIVRACNSYASSQAKIKALVAALEEARYDVVARASDFTRPNPGRLDSRDRLRNLDALLALAKEGQS